MNVPETPKKQPTGLSDNAISLIAFLAIIPLGMVLAVPGLAILLLPLWVALGFGVIIGVRRQFSLRTLFVFITLEAASLALAMWMMNQLIVVRE